MASLPPPGPPGSNVYVGSTVEDAFYDAHRRWATQRDSDPNRLSTHDLVEQAFAAHGLRIEPIPADCPDLDGCYERLLESQLREARSAIESEIAMASDPEGKDQFEKGALAAYKFALSVLPVAPSNLGGNDG